jgi:hypothetical protein
MNVYQLLPDVEHFRDLEWVDGVSVVTVQQFNGQSLRQTWQAPRVRYAAESDLPIGDLTGSIPPVVTRHALDALSPLIAQDVEALPLYIDDRELFALNVLTVIDCLNRDHSVYTTFSNSERIIWIEKYSFRQDMLKDRSIFRLPERDSNLIYVLDPFKELVEKNKLLGFKFRLLS